MQVDALILPTVTGIIPNNPINLEQVRKFKKLQLADPQYYQPGEIDILLGADVTLRLLGRRQIRSSATGPVAQLTKLGWVIGGNTDHKHKSASSTRIHFTTVEDNLEKQLQRFWEWEEPPAGRLHNLNPEQQKVM